MKVPLESNTWSSSVVRSVTYTLAPLLATPCGWLKAPGTFPPHWLWYMIAAGAGDAMAHHPSTPATIATAAAQYLYPDSPPTVITGIGPAYPRPRPRVNPAPSRSPTSVDGL